MADTVSLTDRTYQTLSDAVSDVLAAAAILEVVAEHLHRNAVTVADLGPPYAFGFRKHMLSPNEALAFDHANNAVVMAADALRDAFDGAAA